MKDIKLVPDMSHHQKNDALAMEWLEHNTCNHIILKATEGETYRDDETINMLDSFLYQHDCIGTQRVVIGLYHFCRLDNLGSMQTVSDRAEKEMYNFFDVITDCIIYAKENYGTKFKEIKFVPILDWEAESLKKSNRDKYLLACVEYCIKHGNTLPIIYCSASVTKSTECKALKEEYPAIGLWVAHYNKKKPDVSTWAEWVGWQFTSTPFDLSFIRNTFETYCIKNPDKRSDSCTC